MSAKIIDGERVAREIRERLKEEVQVLANKGRVPRLSIIVLRSPFARVHVARLKEKTCRQLGIKCHIYYLPETTTEGELSFLIERLNNSRDIHGINIHPLPPRLNHTQIFQQVDPQKDIEGLHFLNLGNFFRGKFTMVPFVAQGIIKIIESTGETIEGKRAVIIGRSQLVGKPASFLLLENNATVSICHTHTTNLEKFTKSADILIAAAGHPHTVNQRMVKEGAIVVDVGVNQIGTKLVGDVDYDEVKNVAGWITPVPGGLGPVTIATLLHNLVEAAKNS
jgi:methylenetetrahydrofolate dehydrogenase (NADP+)/methenyltetrahydrofolate cyclohydrolase